METELSAKVDACAAALLVMSALLHERGVLDAADVSDAWKEHAKALDTKEDFAGQWLGRLANKLASTAAHWPAAGTARGVVA